MPGPVEDAVVPGEEGVVPGEEGERPAEAARLASTLRRLGLEAVADPTVVGVLLCRAPGHPYVAQRLRQVGIPVRSAGRGDAFVVDVVDRPASDRLAAALWTMLCAV